MSLILNEIALFKKHVFPRWKHGDEIIQLGSCFSTNMTTWFRRAGFDVLDNPFGVIFHPLVIADHLSYILEEVSWKPVARKEELYLSYDAGSKLYATSSEALYIQLEERKALLEDKLTKAKVLFITLGSAHGYVLNETGQVVANCHQQRGDLFTKRLFETEELFPEWDRVLRLMAEGFPDLQIIFTISPVRYTKDGVVENNQSKAELIRLIRQLQAVHSVYYFPSYELVNDILRDYRFFERDLVHPNELATEKVWELCRHFCFDEPTQAIISDLFQLRLMEEHRFLHPDSAQTARFKEEFHKKRESFLSLFPAVVW